MEQCVEPAPAVEQADAAPQRRILIAVSLAALVSYLWQLHSFPGPGFGRYWESLAIARSLAAGHGFSNPFGALDTGPTAHLAPLFPMFLAGLLRIFGDTGQFVFAAILLCAAAHALYCALFVPLSWVLFGDRKPGVWAAIFSAIVPTIQVLPQWDAIYAAVAAQLFCLASARLLRANRGALAGALCGLLLLLNPAMLLVAAMWLAYLRPPARWLAAFALGAVLVCLPWTVRNYRQFGAVFYLRDNLGSELYTSNADCADARDAVNKVNGCHNLLQPNISVREASLVRDMGEYQYNRSRMAEARRWIREHPARFRELTLRRIREFWFPTPEHPPIYEYARWLVTALSVAGLIVLVRQRSRAAIFLGGAMALYPILYYFVQASTRFRSPVLWISVLPAAFVLTQAARRGSLTQNRDR